MLHSDKYKFTYQWYNSYKEDDTGVYISKKNPKKSKDILSRMKAIHVDFYRSELKALGEKSANAFLEELTSFGNYEYFHIGEGGKKTKVPQNLKNHQLENLGVTMEGTCDLSDLLPSLQYLKELHINADRVITGDLSSMKNLEVIDIKTDNWENDHYLESAPNLQKIILKITDLSHQQLSLSKLKQLIECTIHTQSIDISTLKLKDYTTVENIELKVNEVIGIERIFDLENLQKLILDGNVGDQLFIKPTDFSSLKVLDLNLNGCKEIKVDIQYELDALTLFVAEGIKGIDSSILSTPTKKMQLYGHLEHLSSSGSLQLSNALTELNLTSETDKEVQLPSMTANLLQTLDLNIKNLQSFDDSFIDFPELSHLYVHELSSSMSFGRFEKLAKIKINQSTEEQHSITFGENALLKKLSIEGLKAVLEINVLPKNLSKIEISESHQLHDIIISETFPFLERLEIAINHRENIITDPVLPELLKIEQRHLPKLDLIRVGTDSLKSISSEITQFEKLWIYPSYETNKDILRYKKYFELVTVIGYGKQLPEDCREALFHLSTRKENTALEYAQICDALKLFQFTHKDLLEYLRVTLPLFNADNTSFQSLVGQKKKVIFVGSTGTTKTQLKEDAKALNWSVTSKVDQADIIVIGKKYSFKTHPKEGACYFTEKDFIELCKTETPKYLEEDNAESQGFTENLKSLLTSDSPENELLAFELIKSG
ncbi:leucine-rich repeat domain-containing protein [Flammeovirga aprica]|uniref:Uncharacterized protein n=1 Tax=Flammeovirga aprica JL-4 TaxID=694437 RepID=A0A7X9S1X5_9BACT|nr:hypothetical protein [Flammeovirga aprica]NME72786.1 hypothetical protein [Flammeovirga aprica JL-4]